MRKYMYCIAMVMLTTALLTGCGSGIELSEEENAMIAEYMAAALLKYDTQYEDELIYAEAAEVEESFVPVDSMEDMEETSNKEEASKTELTAPEDTGNSEEQTVVTLNDIFKSEKYEVTYAGVKEYQTYKEENNDYFIVEAPSGCKLLAAEFRIQNLTSEDVLVSLAEKEITYELITENGLKEKPLLTALMGDLQYYNETIPAGESKTAVVVFAVAEEVNTANGALLIEKKGSEARISLQ